MEKAIIGKKIGMTQIFDEAGRVVPVTLIQAGPCTVVQKKTAEKDGYEMNGAAAVGVALDGRAVALDNALEAVALADAGHVHPSPEEGWRGRTEEGTQGVQAEGYRQPERGRHR